MRKPTILLLERDEPLWQQVRTALADSVFDIRNIHDKRSVLPFLKQQTRPALVIVGPSLDSAWDELSIAEEIRSVDATIPVILVTRLSSEDRAIKAVKLHLDDYFRMPLLTEDFITSICHIYEHTPSLARMRSGETEDNDGLIGDSTAMGEIKTNLYKVAATDCNVLITGETGTGKERVATLIHRCSPRNKKPLMCINCAALPDGLVEGELFGYERGAFTGAAARYEGKLKLADGGSVFFDEIGDMAAYAQAKVLRAIENREVFRLGGRCSIPLDIRVIAATNHDLEKLVEEGRFRADLYYRLNVVNIHLPPLRSRKEDIPSLVKHYLHEYNRRFSRQVGGFTHDVEEMLVAYNWPGNVRELKNVLEATFVNNPGNRIEFVDLPEPFRRRCNVTWDTTTAECERLLRALLATDWNKSKAAQSLHWSRMTLYRKMAKHGLDNRRAGLLTKTVTSARPV